MKKNSADPLTSDLRDQFKNHLILPGQEGYEQASGVFYSGLNSHPEAIARPVDAIETAELVKWAHKNGQEMAVKGGGHSLAGSSAMEGGLLLDLSAMKSLEIDPQGRSAWAGAGLSAGEYTTEAAKYDLATGFGDTGTVGIGGLTLGGGMGYLSRNYGLTIDDLLAAEVVTADGQVGIVDSGSHPDLFWALRGGGGNFGVVTRFQFRLHEVASVVGGLLILPATVDNITSFIEAAARAPDELSTIANVMVAPPMPFLPKEVHGQLILMAMLVYAGAEAMGERVIAPFRKLDKPLADMIKPMRYPEIYQSEQGGFHPAAVGTNFFVDTIERSVAIEILERLKKSTAFLSAAQLRVLGGAVERVPVDATAFAHRQRKIMVNLGALYQNPAERPQHEAWIRDFAAALYPGSSGAYVNFLGETGMAAVQAAYPAPTLERLAKIKGLYDPDNFFHHNANIPPVL